MYSNRDHASIDVELADSLSGKLNTLHYPSSKECCIYRVPQKRRCLNPRDYTPEMLSIGPLHYGNAELKAMEDNKLRYLHHFLQRTKVRMPQFVAFIREREAKLRSCYAETIHLESDVFVTMTLVDAVFLIELFLRRSMPYCRTDNDPLFRETGLSFLGLQVRYDLYLEENQLPLFILSELFDLAKTATYSDIYFGISLTTITSFFFFTDSAILPIGDMDLIDTHFSEAKHFLDLIILCLQPSQSHYQSEFNYQHTPSIQNMPNIQNTPSIQNMPNIQNTPSIKELHQASAKFESRSSQNLLDIKFNKGILGIPFFLEHGFTERLYRNLLAFEIMHGYPLYFSDYVVIMSYLLRTPKDADLLNQNEIIRLGDSERFSTALQSLRRDSLGGDYFHYADVVKDLQAFCKSPWHRWKANLKQNYFNTPWASISVIAAVILLLFTVTQTVCSIIAL